METWKKYSTHIEESVSLVRVSRNYSGEGYR